MVNLFKLRLQSEYLRFLIKRNARYMFILSIAMLTLYPVLGITVFILSRATNYDGIREVGLFFNIALLMFTSFMIPLQVHSYMNSKKNLDVYHALPIKRQNLFLTSMIASILIIIVPFTIGWFSGGLLMMSNDFTFLVILERYVVLISIAVAIMSVVLFTMMNTGTSLDAFLYSVTLNFLPLLAYGAYILFVQTILLGFTIGNLTKIITIIFPIWALFDSGLALKTGLWDNAYLNAIYWLVVSGVILAFANQFYLKRKSEKAEKPFTNKTFFPVVSGAIVILLIIFEYCIIYNLNSQMYFTSFYNPINFIFPLFFSAVLYLVMDAIAERGFKHLLKAFITYLIIAAVAVGILVGGIATKGFGYASKLPSLSNIESIDFSYKDYSNIVIPVPNTSVDTGNSIMNAVLNLTSANDIQTIYNLHKIIISEYKWIDYNYTTGYNGNLIKIIEEQAGYHRSYTPFPFYMDTMYTGGGADITITYHLKNGGDLQRSYMIPTEWTSELLSLGNSAEIIKLTAPNLALSKTYPILKSVTWVSPLYGVNKQTSTGAAVNINLSELKAAYLLDLSGLSDAQVISTDYTALGILFMTTCQSATSPKCVNSSIDVDTRYPHVMTLLQAAGINFNPQPLQAYPKAVLLIPTISSALINDTPLFRVAIPQFTERYSSELFINYGDQGTNRLTYVRLSEEELKMILPYVSQKGISSEPLMSLYLEGQSGNLLIQLQYVDEVNAIIAGKTQETTQDIYSIFTQSSTK